MLWPLLPGKDVIEILEERGIFDFDDLDEEHDVWTEEALAAHAMAQADTTGNANPYPLTLQLTDIKYSKVNSTSTIDEIAEWWDYFISTD